ncbi:MAG TPA: type II toxin-antitoxin system RelE/ParE family toxin [Solirubrobacterales bacterium]|nr:type II toxin-antitoxin system RelE/ParE family toxin [Solirubrobacterales bacterium]
MATQAIYYRAADGSEPVAEFLDEEFPVEPRKKNPSPKEIATAAEKRVTIDLQIDRLNDLPNDAPPLPFPHTSQISGPLRELRCHYGRALYRVLYRRSENFFILLHIFRKNTGAVPEAEIEIAKERWDDFKARMDAKKRVPPRAAGHDAP